MHIDFLKEVFIDNKTKDAIIWKHQVYRYQNRADEQQKQRQSGSELSVREMPAALIGYQCSFLQAKLSPIEGSALQDHPCAKTSGNLSRI